MSASDASVPFVQSVFHPTDFSPDSEAAFAHALAIAVVRQAELTVLHAGSEYLSDDEWEKFPHVREMLAAWNLIERDASLADVHRKLGVRVNKVDAEGDPVEAVLEHLRDEPADLMVLATAGRQGLPRWLRRSTAEQIADAAGAKTLFVRRGARSFVSPQGDVHLRRILVPVAETPDPQPALVYAARATVLAAGEPVELLALHVGEGMPDLELPEAEGCTWRKVLGRGDVVDEIVRVAELHEADAIFMATDGRNTVAELLRGSHTEQVVRRAPCPVAAIPQE